MEFTTTNFTPWLGFVGGALIGLASGMMFLLLGKITGISGIAAGLMSRNAGGIMWRAMFILGLILAAVLYPLFTGEPVPVNFQVGLPMMAIGGFLVGFGTRMGSGCTAGHGICGISRLSLRSVVATTTFFATAIITVYIVRYLMEG